MFPCAPHTHKSPSRHSQTLHLFIHLSAYFSTLCTISLYTVSTYGRSSVSAKIIYMARGHGNVQKKILLLLLGGVALGLSGSPRQYFKTIKAIRRGWDELSNATLCRAIRPLYSSKLVSSRPNNDGTHTLILTDKGRQWALTYKLEKMLISTPEKWDKKWRIVMFDIPEKYRRTRNLFRIQLRMLGFRELQKSVFVHPYPCIDEIEYVAKFYRIGKYVRFIIADSIDNEAYLKRSFDLS